MITWNNKNKQRGGWIYEIKGYCTDLFRTNYFKGGGKRGNRRWGGRGKKGISTKAIMDGRINYSDLGLVKLKKVTDENRITKEEI